VLPVDASLKLDFGDQLVKENDFFLIADLSPHETAGAIETLSRSVDTTDARATLDK
jgi:hypothetical protein